MGKSLGSEFLSLYICLLLFFKIAKLLNETRIQIFDILVIQLRRSRISNSVRIIDKVHHSIHILQLSP